MSFRNDFIQLSDTNAMRALAHRTRLDIFNFLLDADDATATECADAIGESPSSCSYHLRILARHGFVESVETEDGRERRWKLLVKSFDIAADSPEQRAAGAALSDQLLQQDDEMVKRFLTEKAGFPDEWQKAALFSRSNLHMTSDELGALKEQYLELLKPLVDREAERAWPEGAKRVRMILRAVPWSSNAS